MQYIIIETCSIYAFQNYLLTQALYKETTASGLLF